MAGQAGRSNEELIYELVKQHSIISDWLYKYQKHFGELEIGRTICLLDPILLALGFHKNQLDNELAKLCVMHLVKIIDFQSEIEHENRATEILAKVKDEINNWAGPFSERPFYSDRPEQ